MKEFKGYEKGINLGGWFSQCNHTKDRYDNFIKKEDLRIIKDWGADHVRLPIDYNLVEETDGTYIEEGFTRIQEVIGWCREYKLNLILDLHKTFGYSFDSGEKEEGFFESEKYQERFYKLWEKLAEKFAKNEDMMAFELLNEVTDKSYCQTWNKISAECVKRIRKIAPTIKILVGSYWNNSVYAVKDLPMPFDENIVYNFHCYEPLIFTHQGGYWVAGMDTKFRMNLKEPFSVYEANSKKNLKMFAAGFESFTPETTMSSEYFETIFAEAIKIAEERNVALYCGEYGVINLADATETLEWYKMINAVFKKHNIGRAAWSYREMDFGIADEHMASVRSELLKYI